MHSLYFFENIFKKFIIIASIICNLYCNIGISYILLEQNVIVGYVFSRTVDTDMPIYNAIAPNYEEYYKKLYDLLKLYIFDTDVYPTY